MMWIILFLAIFMTMAMAAADSGSPVGKIQKLNRLAGQQSPYLLQHADNPVNWYPWGPEAFRIAAGENKPIFLSIGYSTCHWCHVMEHESFEDENVARLLNETFVCIKVDREERPDIDSVYMTVCQMLTGSGGWPLTIFMTSDQKPFFAGTYFPKTQRFGQIGMMELIPRIQDLWQNHRKELFRSAEEITQALRQIHREKSDLELSSADLDAAFENLHQNYDESYGGFGAAPKFPTPAKLVFLLRYGKRTGNPNALEMVEHTLQAMRKGGIYDHIGFGFHRYSTDPKWLVPHFEKMLYDQALLAIAYLETYQVTQNSFYAQTAREILTYVLRDMTSSEGGFYSAEDADSEGVEGKFYLWTEPQIKDLLSADIAGHILQAFHVEGAGNFSEDFPAANILHLTQTPAELENQFQLSESKFLAEFEHARTLLFNAREKRVHPHKDDKVLADWNGLMISAFARAAFVLDDPAYNTAGCRAADFILNRLADENGILLHRYRNGQAAIPAHLEDYAFFTQALLDLYESTFDPRYLEHAVRFNQQMIDRFEDASSGGFFLTAVDGEKLLIRSKNLYDGAIPSGNSVALLNLLRLARITANSALEEKADLLTHAFASAVRSAPAGCCQLLSSFDFALGPLLHIVLVGNPGASDTRVLLQSLRKPFLPNKIVLFKPDSSADQSMIRLAPYIKDIPFLPNAAVYICENYSCQLPISNSQALLQKLH